MQSWKSARHRIAASLVGQTTATISHLRYDDKWNEYETQAEVPPRPGVNERCRLLEMDGASSVHIEPGRTALLEEPVTDLTSVETEQQ